MSATLDQLYDQADALYPGGLIVARNVNGVPPAGGDGLVIPAPGQPVTPELGPHAFTHWSVPDDQVPAALV